MCTRCRNLSIMFVCLETVHLSVKQTQGHIEQEDLNRLFSLLSRYGFVCRAVIIPTALVDFSERSLYRARSVSMGSNGDFENRHTIFYFFTYRPEILHTPRGRQYAGSCQTDF